MKGRKQIWMENPLLEDLKGYLYANGVSQREAAKAIGVSPITLNRWMNGHCQGIHEMTERIIRKYIGRK